MSHDNQQRGSVTTRIVSAYRVHLDLPHLEQVVRAGEELFQPARLSLRTDCAGTTFAGATLRELIDRVAGSLERDDPDRLDNLRIECVGLDRRVLVAIADDRAMVTVTAEDPAWVNGKAAQLLALLLRGGAARRPLRWGRASCCAAATIGVGVGAAVTLLVPAGRPGGWAIIGAVAVTVLSGLAGLLVGRRRQRRARTRLFVAGAMPPTPLWARMSIIERLVCASTLVAIAGLIVNLVVAI